MKLSDRHYNILTRSGLLIAIAAALSYDRVPVAYGSFVIVAAIIGGVIGFLPLLVPKKPEEFDGRGAQLDAPTQIEELEPVVEVVEDLEPLEVSYHDLSEDRYLTYLYSTLGKELKRARYSEVFLTTAVADHLHCAFDQGNKEEERSNRVKEMCDVVQMLGTETQQFSVELTSENSIIVHWDQPKAGQDLRHDIIESWALSGDTTNQQTIN